MNFKIRCSAIHDIAAGEIGLTDKQKQTMLSHLTREADAKLGKAKPLPPSYVKELAYLKEKEANPELPQGAKTYCENWLKETKYKRWKDINSKYIDKGNFGEEDLFTLICVQMKLGMVKKNSERKSNAYMNGECDIFIKERDTIIDGKSSWDLPTFPMYKNKLPDKDKRYEDQIQGYMELWNCSKGIVVYGLIDCPEPILLRQFPYNGTPDERQKVAINLIFTKKYWDEMKSKYFADAEDIEFVEIPAEKRVKPFYFKRDRSFIAKVEQRVKMCNEYIETLV